MRVIGSVNSAFDQVLSRHGHERQQLHEDRRRGSPRPRSGLGADIEWKSTISDASPTVSQQRMLSSREDSHDNFHQAHRSVLEKQLSSWNRSYFYERRPEEYPDYTQFNSDLILRGKPRYKDCAGYRVGAVEDHRRKPSSDG
ncbi:hypothetical protein Q5P01_001023 [Channa striata]|uniref:Uncharacterized protein n=1 Tax=Channa striata TaxID=64152 RepID=A0AA88IZJ2_CHASR|nr:hypothetical protein Q5P01_001023 [Channa striata]